MGHTAIDYPVSNPYMVRICPMSLSLVRVTSTLIASKASSNPFTNTSETSKTALSVKYPNKTMNKTPCGSY